ncbi:thiolase family protein, partial [Pseudonocardia pini]|uniref:thiolase family protein n=1 Tax=Pseudonocardia pini TaxID=2758030 RepID=UPI00406BAB2B
MSEPVVIAARRTAIGNAGGVLKALSADELAAPVLRALLADVGVVAGERRGEPEPGGPGAPGLPAARGAEQMSPGRAPGTPGCEVAVRDVVLGNVFGPGGNTARVAALRAGLGDGVPGLTVDRQCASGLAAITLACS